MPGLGGRGPPGRGGIPAAPGVRGAAGRGGAVPPPTPNGLLPTRGPGRTPGVAAGGAVGADAAGATGAAGAAGAGGAAVTAGSGACTTGGSGAGAGRLGAAGAASAGAAGAAAAAFLAGAFLAGAGAASGNASRSLRATGASTVDEAVLTYSPISVSFSIATLLVSPSSLARAETRILPGTCLLREDRATTRAVPSRRWSCSSLVLHRVLISSSSPAGFRWVDSCRCRPIVNLRNVLAHRCWVDGAGHSQCPGEGPAPLREFDTSLIGMQPRAPTGDAAKGVGHDRQGNGPAAEQVARGPGLRRTWCHRSLADRIRRHDDAEQFGSPCPLSTSDASSNGALWGHSGPSFSRGCRRRTAAAIQSTPRGSVRPIPPRPAPLPRSRCGCRCDGR
jgi:hypothetical protein